MTLTTIAAEDDETMNGAAFAVCIGTLRAAFILLSSAVHLAMLQSLSLVALIRKCEAITGERELRECPPSKDETPLVFGLFGYWSK